MKHQKLLLFPLLLSLVLVLGLMGCKEKSDPTGLWKDALYTKDKAFGKGATELKVEVKAGEKSVIFTVQTDQDTVGAALLENGLIEGEEGAYGLYIKKVNGITADYDIDQSYWAFYINGEYAMTGVDTTPIEEGMNYQLVYEK